jgi:hypothetical protein
MTNSTLQQWHNGVRLAQVSHARAAARYDQLHQILGLSVTVISVIVGTSVFSTLSSTNNTWILGIVGAISVVAAILSGIQTFLNYGQVAAKHQSAANKYGKIRRRIEELLNMADAPAEMNSLVKAIREDWDILEDEAPTVPQRFHDVARDIVLGQGSHPST